MDKAQVIQDETELVLRRFTEEDALALGRILMRLAQEDDHPVVIDIRTANRTLFHAAMPGSEAVNDRWARRKSNTALMLGKSSLRAWFDYAESGGTLVKHALDAADFADSGGAVPVRVKGVGIVAVATVSGLSHMDDHALVVRALREAMKAG